MNIRDYPTLYLDKNLSKGTAVSMFFATLHFTLRVASSTRGSVG